MIRLNCRYLSCLDISTRKLWIHRVPQLVRLGIQLWSLVAVVHVPARTIVCRALHSIVPWYRIHVHGLPVVGCKVAQHVRVQATVTSGVVSAPFHRLVLPQTMDSARFQKYTAQGKLKAEMMATCPRRGFLFR